jgi:putative transposase
MGPNSLARQSEWYEIQGIALHLIQPVKPTLNAYIQRFNGSCLCQLIQNYVFRSLISGNS